MNTEDTSVGVLKNHRTIVRSQSGGGASEGSQHSRSMDQQQLEHANSLTDVASANQSTAQPITEEKKDQDVVVITTNILEDTPSESLSIHVDSKYSFRDETNERNDANFAVETSENKDINDEIVESNNFINSKELESSADNGRPSSLSADSKVTLMSNMFIKLRFVDIPKTFSAIDKEGITIFCRFEGEAKSCEWMKEDKIIKNDEDFHILLTEDGFASLSIRDVIYPDDSGTYTCNLIGQDDQPITRNILLDVRKALRAPMHRRSERRLTCDLNSVLTGPKGPPSFLIGLPGSLEVKEKHCFTLRCKIEGSEPMSVEWLHPNGGVVVSDEKGDIVVDKQQSSTRDFIRASLSLTGVVKQDEGQWACRAANEYGMAKTVTEITIHEVKDISRGGYDSSDSSDSEPFAFVSKHPNTRSLQYKKPLLLAAHPPPIDTTKPTHAISNAPRYPQSLAPPWVPPIPLQTKGDAPFAMVRLRKSSEPPIMPRKAQLQMFDSTAIDLDEPSVLPPPSTFRPKQPVKKAHSLNPNDLSSMGTPLSMTRVPSSAQPEVRTFQGVPFGQVKIIPNTRDLSCKDKRASTISIEVDSSSSNSSSSTTISGSGSQTSMSKVFKPQHLEPLHNRFAKETNLSDVRSQDDPKALSFSHNERKRPELDDVTTKDANSKHELIRYLQSLPDSIFEEGKVNKELISRAVQGQQRLELEPNLERKQIETTDTGNEDCESFPSVSDPERRDGNNASTESINCDQSSSVLIDEKKNVKSGDGSEFHEEINVEFVKSRNTKISEHSFEDSDLLGSGKDLPTTSSARSRTLSQKTTGIDSDKNQNVEKRDRTDKTRTHQEDKDQAQSIAQAPQKKKLEARPRPKSPGKIPGPASLTRPKTPIEEPQLSQTKMQQPPGHQCDVSVSSKSEIDDTAVLKDTYNTELHEGVQPNKQASISANSKTANAKNGKKSSVIPKAFASTERERKMSMPGNSKVVNLEKRRLSDSRPATGISMNFKTSNIWKPAKQ